MKCFMPKTRSEINSDTIVFFSHVIDFPQVTADSFIQQALQDIVTLLANPPPTTVPSLQVGDTTKHGLLQIASLLNKNPLTPSILHNQQSNQPQQPSTLVPPTPTTKPSLQLLSSQSKPYTSTNSVKHALTRLTRVLEKKSTLRPSRASTSFSYKHRAAQFLKNNTMFASITPDRIAQNTMCVSISFDRIAKNDLHRSAPLGT